MIKIVINIIAFLLSLIIIAFGGYQTVVKSDFNTIASDFQSALETKPEMPPKEEKPNDEEPAPPVGGEDIEIPDMPDIPVFGGDAVDTFSQLFDTYDPDLAEINKQILSNMVSTVIPEGTSNGDAVSSLVNSYIDQLYTEIDNIQLENENATEEEKAAAKEEFAQKEAAAYEGLMNLVNSTTNEEASSEEAVMESVDAILDSKVVSSTIQDAAEDLDESTKNQIQGAIQGAIDANRGDEDLTEEERQEKEDRFKALADLFGVVIDGNSAGEIPEWPF